MGFKQFDGGGGSGGGGGVAFSSITAGTNAAALVVGTGGSLTISGSGTVNATSLGGTAAASYALLANPTFTTAITTPVLNITQGTITADAPGINHTVTWNGAGIVGPAWGLNVTNTSSDPSARLMDLKVGGNSKFWVGYQGNAVFAGQVTFVGSATFSTFSSFSLGLYLNSRVVLQDDAANIHAWRDGTSANAGRIYRTWTDASNYERLALQTGSGYVELAAETAGTGTDNLDVRLTPAGTGAVSFSGHLLARTDNTYDIGASGATRPRNIYVAGLVVAGGYIEAGTNAGFFVTGKSGWVSPSDGVIRLSNNGLTDFSRLQLGGTTSSFPAIKRNAAILEARLADDSAAGTWQGKHNSSDGSAGVSVGPYTVITAITVKDGLVTSLTGS